MPAPRTFPPLPAPYRSRPDESRGRLVPERDAASRSAFQRDRDRIIHSTAFRRLAQKTQVFLPDEGDHFRTRLTHTIEVGQITRTLTRALGLDDDLGEALALAHDLGHSPFGHTGEDALADVMRPFGGFDHNVQTLRIVMFLERRYPAFPGLNLSWETLDGLAQRGAGTDGLVNSPDGWLTAGLPGFAGGDWGRSLARGRFPAGEAQAAALADDIAYNAHDLEDGLQAGLFALEDLDAVPVLRSMRDALASADPGLADDLLVHGLARELVGRFVEGVIAESTVRLSEAAPQRTDDIRGATRPLVALPDDLAADSAAIKRFLFARMYRHPRLVALRSRARAVIGELAEALLARPELLPDTWRQPCADVPPPVWHARRVADYVASMTDRFALSEHHRIFDRRVELR